MKTETVTKRIERISSEYTSKEIDRQVLKLELEVLVEVSKLEYIQGKL